MTPLVDFAFYRPSTIVRDDESSLIVRGVEVSATRTRIAGLAALLLGYSLIVFLAYRYTPLREHVWDLALLLSAACYTLWLLVQRRRSANRLLIFDKRRKTMEVEPARDRRKHYPLEDIQLVWKTTFFLRLPDEHRIPLRVGGNTQVIMKIYEAMGRELPAEKEALRAIDGLMRKRNAALKAKQRTLYGRKAN